MARRRKNISSDMAWSTVDSITVKGRSLTQDILGKMNLGDYAFLEILSRSPSPQESTVFNAVLATLVEHGMTPMAITTRLTYLGAPESLQGAVAAGILGMGTTFAGTAEGAAQLLQEAIPNPKVQLSADDLKSMATSIVAKHIASKRPIPGIGHRFHKPIDPRTPRLFAIASENHLSGHYVELMKYIAQSAEEAMGKPGLLPVNATGAIGALASELGVPWRLCRGLAVIGRTIGLVGHLAEEMNNPIAREIWERADEESSAHHHGGVA